MLNNSTQNIETIFNIGGIVGILLIIAGIISWLLCVVLFFKIWGMTNDIEKIKKTLDRWLSIEHPPASEDDYRDKPRA